MKVIKNYMMRNEPRFFCDFLDLSTTSGNRIVDLYARIKCDIINLKPDYLSVLVGVNDVWHELGYNNGVDAEKFEKIYDLLISEVKTALPDIKIMLLGAFVLKSTETEQNWDVFSSEVPKMAAATKRIAEKYGCTYVPLQEKFDEAVKRHAEPYWTAEGVHPMPAGHELIAKEWIKAFDQMSK